MATFEGLALSEGGKIVDCNERLAEIFGYTPEELRGFPIAELSAPETREQVRAAVATGHEMPYHHVGLRKDGTSIPIEVRARMVRKNDRWIRLSAVRDLTDQLRSAHELERRNAEMEQFVYTVSHDLKSPIITIKGFVGAIAGDLAGGRTATVAKDLERIARATDRMTALLDDLLEFSRIGRVAAIVESVPLGEIARDALELLAGPIATRRAVIELEPLPTMRCGSRT
jgi:PAS domain S-box-containing protein